MPIHLLTNGNREQFTHLIKRQSRVIKLMSKLNSSQFVMFALCVKHSKKNKIK